MAELIDTIMKINGMTLKNMGITDMVIGTVSRIEPTLQIRLEETMLPLEEAILVKTDAVIEKKITINGHAHQYLDQYDGGSTTRTTEIGFESITCTENNIPLPVEGNVITINRGLALNDKVLLLRVLNGGKYIIWSRIYD